MGFKLTSYSAHETRLPREGHGAHPLPGFPRPSIPSALVSGAQRILPRLPGDQEFSKASDAFEEPAINPQVTVSATLLVSPVPAALQHLHLQTEQPSCYLGTSPLAPLRLSMAFSPAGRRPKSPAAPRPQGNRKEPMTDRGPSERNPPSTQPESQRTSFDGRTSIRQGVQSPRAFGL